MQDKLAKPNKKKKLGRTITVQPDKLSRALLIKQFEQRGDLRGFLSFFVNDAIHRAYGNLAGKREAGL